MKKVVLILGLLFFTFTSFSQDVFDVGIRNIEIFFSEPNWDDTLDLYYANDLGQRLIADSVLIDGIADQDVGIKYKGNSSYNINNVKNPLNIRLNYVNNGQSIDGYNVLKLSNGFKDPTLVREVLSYEIAREYMPSSKATYANVYINGNWNGIYTCIQSVDDDFTNEHFYERKGPFFKADNTNIIVSGCPPGPLGILSYYTDTNCYQRAYEIQSTNDWTQLGNFLDTLNNHFTEIETVMDIDRALWMMAFENLTVCLDGPINAIPHNYYLFKDNNGRFSPIIWDMNQAFGTFTNGLPTPVTNQSLQQLDAFYGSTNNQNILTSQIFSSDQYKRMYIAHMRTIINEYFSNNQYHTRALQLQQLIDASVAADPNLFFPYATFQTNLNSTIGNNIGLTELMDARVAYLQGLSEFTASPPSITNLSSNPTAVLPHSTVSITAAISNTNYAYLGYRFKFSDKFEKIEMYDDGLNGDGTAGDGIFGATINIDARDVQYYIYAENTNAGIFSPERAEKEFHQLVVVSGLVINEVMAANFSAVADQSGEFDDWVELYNGNNFSLNLNGYYLSDSENDLTKWTFPNVTIPANDYLIIWCDTAGGTQSGLHTTYRLSADQEEVYLTAPTGIVIDAVHYVNMPTDMGYARVPNGTGPMQYQTQTYDDNNQNGTGIANINVSGKMRVYPNPSNNRIYILGATESIAIFNMMGQKVYTENQINSVDITSWENGIYFVKSGNSVVKILKQ
ncbi:MAG TPA: T9SS type A sorting domain-containing protein [Flavobacteriales bacterium]|nr:T9SS type A sorting domain-containing protein [Flavobacteriales bacterium]